MTLDRSGQPRDRGMADGVAAADVDQGLAGFPPRNGFPALLGRRDTKTNPVCQERSSADSCLPYVRSRMALNSDKTCAKPLEAPKARGCGYEQSDNEMRGRRRGRQFGDARLGASFGGRSGL